MESRILRYGAHLLQSKWFQVILKVLRRGSQKGQSHRENVRGEAEIKR
jgi:hypothetical protein